MFTGIIEELGEIVSIDHEGTNVNFCVQSAISSELRIDQSVAHNGVCLTVTQKAENKHWVTAVDETIKKSNLGQLKVGDGLNMERCMIANGRFDGHVVQGHVDMVAHVAKIKEEQGSWLYDFEYGQADQVMVDKGSITVNGVSLTCFDTTMNSFRVAIIPFTHEHTNFGKLEVGDAVNLEFDIIGKYVQKLLDNRTGE